MHYSDGRVRGLAAIALAVCIVFGASPAGAEAKLLPKSSLWSQIKPDITPDEVKALCKEILARETSSTIGMLDASHLYLDGQIMGTSCIKVDYWKGYELARDAGDAFTIKAVITYITDRANGGNAKAQKALEKIKKERD